MEHAAAGTRGPNLDFVRGNLFDPARLRTLPPDASGPDNDLADLLDHYVRRARSTTRTPGWYVFGERFGPEPTVKDKVFGFLPGNGVHDIHMNQGNSRRFSGDDGIWQDGGILIHFPAQSRWVAIFLAFQSQSWHTDDTTGHTLEGTDGNAQRARRAARPGRGGPGQPAWPRHPSWRASRSSTHSPDPADLTGWHVRDRLGNSCAVPAAAPLAAGAPLLVPLTDGVQLGNKGGEITLLDAGGLKVHGVSYTAEQAAREGWTVVF
ncbi:DUF2278 family protein [Streptomyces sp. L7]